MPVVDPPPTLRKTIALLVYDGLQVLDATGPAAVFGAANDAAGQACYQVLVLSAAGGVVQSNCAAALFTQALGAVDPTTVDTVLLCGGDERVRAFVRREPVAAWIRAAQGACRRLGSVCTGAFGLAELGLLDGKRAATHWSAAAQLAEDYPQVSVDPRALFVRDGKLWSSAGVSAGIDMALAMVAEDLGEAILHPISRRLVLYARRPGDQSQFSEVLVAQGRAAEGFAELIEWIRQRLDQPLDVAQLAERVAMSPRNFHRKFTRVMGQTPAQCVEGLRMELARQLLSHGVSVKAVAAQCAYRSVGMFAKAFERHLAMSPSVYQALHRTAA